MVQELGKQNPELLTLINANQQEFLRIINEPLPPEQAQEVTQQIAHYEASLGSGGGGGEGARPHDQQPGRCCCPAACPELPTRLGLLAAGLPHETIAVQLTEEEQAVVQRLESLGFDRNRCIEAFLLCERDESLAANFLFDSAMDE